jgi:hypothetical protein
MAIEARAMNKLDRVAILFAAILLLSGCSNTLVFNNGLFMHTVEPLTFNREATKLKETERKAVGRISQFQYPVSAAISVRLGKNGLGDVAKMHGINTIYYADLERWSAVFGLWSQDIVHVYGR